MDARKRQKSSASLAGFRELSEDELDAVIGGKAQQFEIVIDNEESRVIQDISIDDGNVKIGSSSRKTFGAGKKNPFYKKNGKHVHTIDLSNLN